MADEEPQTAHPAPGRRWWKWALLAPLAWLAFVLVAAAAVVLIFWSDEITFLGEDRDERLFSAAKAASVALVEYQRERGRLPSSLSEAPELEEIARRLGEECASRATRVTEVSLPEVQGQEPRPEEWELIVAVVGGKRLAVISGEGEIALSRDVMTRRASRVPEWIEILR